MRRQIRDGAPLVQGDLALDGRHLISMGLRPGPRFGVILSALMDRVLENPELNDQETLEKLVVQWLEEEEGQGS
jgi:tRNA nucleotidyltransferase (CCA-adding enzyme)